MATGLLVHVRAEHGPKPQGRRRRRRRSAPLPGPVHPCAASFDGSTGVDLDCSYGGWAGTMWDGDLSCIMLNIFATHSDIPCAASSIVMGLSARSSTPSSRHDRMISERLPRTRRLCSQRSLVGIDFGSMV
jgi:hypothetical protein